MILTPTITTLLAAAPAAATNSTGLWRGGRPFIDPMNLHQTWWLSLIPLAIFLSLGYKAVRAESVHHPRFLPSVALMATQIILGMVALAATLHILLEFAVPLLST